MPRKKEIQKKKTKLKNFPVGGRQNGDGIILRKVMVTRKRNGPDAGKIKEIIIETWKIPKGSELFRQRKWRGGFRRNPRGRPNPKRPDRRPPYPPGNPNATKKKTVGKKHRWKRRGAQKGLTMVRKRYWWNI
ncbi:MAG: hypothetical protein HKN23_07340 [Verrucomicrobiales bacterium]|nr:hypothetical protein [Verrucomicrobiales bacterium]